MFGRKKMYKKGLVDAMQAYEAFGKKQEDALAYMREEVRSGNKELKEALAGLGDELNGIYKYLNAQEKAALYQLSTPMDLKELDDADKRLLLAVLYQLAENEESALTDNQRAYIRSVQKYLEITNPQTFADLSAIENIDSIDVQKTFLRVVLEFFYLQDSDELSDEQEAVFDYFSVNKKQATVIENEVSRLFNAVGPEGVAEKYGYVPEEESEPVAPADIKDVPVFAENVPGTSFIGSSVSGEIIDELFNSNHSNRFTGVRIYETANYILCLAKPSMNSVFASAFRGLIGEGSDSQDISPILSGWYLLDKRTSEKTHLDVDLKISRDDEPLFDGDTIIYFAHNDNSIYEGDMWLFDLSTLQAPEKLFAVTYRQACVSMCGNRIAFLNDGVPCVYSLDSKKIIKIPVPAAKRTTYFQAVFATKSGVYMSLNDYPQHKLYFYDYASKQVNLLFMFNDDITEIYHVEDQKIYFRCGDYDSARIGMVDLADVQSGSMTHFSREYAANHPNQANYIVQPYYGCLLYLAADGYIKKLNYTADEETNIANCVVDSPVKPFRCVAGWVYYKENGDEGKWYRTSLNNPEEIVFLGDN